MKATNDEGLAPADQVARSLQGDCSEYAMLMTALCRAEGVPKLWCWSMERYQASPFYEKQGFDERHLLRRQFFGEDCWLFGKNIDLSEGIE